MGKYHNILYIALRIAWLWEIKDSSIIASVLSELARVKKSKNPFFKLNAINVNLIVIFFITLFLILLPHSLCFCDTTEKPDEIYYCEQTFERIFLGAIFGSNAPFFIAGWRSDFKDQVSLTLSAIKAYMNEK